MVHLIAAEFLTDERERKYYADHYSCCPPPLFIILITFVEVSVSEYFIIIIVITIIIIIIIMTCMTAIIVPALNLLLIERPPERYFTKAGARSYRQDSQGEALASRFAVIRRSGCHSEVLKSHNLRIPDFSKNPKFAE